MGVCCEDNWSASWSNLVGFGSTTPDSPIAAWDAYSGQPAAAVNPCIAFGYACIQIAADAITRAGTLDKDAVNTAMGETNLTSTMHGPIKFTSTHDSPSVIAVGQWQGTSPNLSFPCVYSLIPSFPTTAQFIFPLPP